MKIVLTTTSFLPRVGGKELALHHLAEALGDRGHQVTLQCRAVPGTTAPVGRAYRVRRFGPSTWGGGRSHIGEVVALGQLVSLRLSTGWDVLNAHGAVACGLHTSLARRFPGGPFVVTVHGGDVRAAGGAGSAVARVLREADLVVAKSQSMRSAVLELGVAPERVVCIANGIALETFTYPPERDHTRDAYGLPREAVVFVSVGRNHPIKDFPTVVKGIALARRANPDLHYVVVGRDAAPLRELARQLGVGEAVHVVGELPHHEVVRLLGAADVFVNSSLSEGSPNSTLEALASGLPCVITDAPGNRDVDAPGALTVVGTTDPEALAQAFGLLAGDSALRATAGEAARAAVAACDWDVVAERYERAYAAAAQTAIRRRKGGR